MGKPEGFGGVWTECVHMSEGSNFSGSPGGGGGIAGLERRGSGIGARVGRHYGIKLPFRCWQHDLEFHRKIPGIEAQLFGTVSEHRDGF